MLYSVYPLAAVGDILVVMPPDSRVSKFLQGLGDSNKKEMFFFLLLERFGHMHSVPKRIRDRPNSA